jgi:hypothetical protein
MRKHKYHGSISRYPYPLIIFGKNEKHAEKEFERVFGEKPLDLFRIY